MTVANICHSDAICIVDENSVRTIMIRDEVIGRYLLVFSKPHGYSPVNEKPGVSE